MTMTANGQKVTLATPRNRIECFIDKAEIMKNSFYLELSEMAQEAISALDEYERTQDTASTNVFELIRRLGVPCLDGNLIKQAILDDVPLREQITFRKVVFSLVGLNTLSGSRGNQGIRSDIAYFQQMVSALSIRAKRSGTPKIFYSWQATLPGSANRNLIRSSLTKAIDELNQELAVEGRDEATLDSDTANTPGSPDIIRTILAKVDDATIFVADITLVNESQPNANVMFELGYALKSIGESNIVLLFNEHYGSTRDLPFDLGLKRAMLYRCSPEDENKASVRKELAAKLKIAIDKILLEPAE